MSGKSYMPGRLHLTRHIKLFPLLSFVVFLIALFFLPCIKGVAIKDYRTGKLLDCHTAGAGGIFSIRYIHSVNKSPVEDFFVIGDGGDIILEKTVFMSFGAGVPAASDDGGKLDVYDDRIEVTGINRRIDNFLLFVGVTAEHRFKMDRDEFLLRQISPPQRNLGISVERISLFNIITLRHHK